MSVYRRNRHVSEYEFFHKALEVRVLVNLFMVDERIVPKRYRLTNALPTIETARDVVYEINRADCFYPSTPENVAERKRHLTLAIADCEQLMLDLQCYIQLRCRQQAASVATFAGEGDAEAPTFHGRARLEDLVREVDEEIALLKGARRRVRLARRPGTTDGEAVQ